jgi:hypothetical protein
MLATCGRNAASIVTETSYSKRYRTWNWDRFTAHALCNNAAVHTAGWRGGRCHRVGLLIVVLALMAPAMNLAMGAMTSIAPRPNVQATGSAVAAAEIDCATTGPSGRTVRLIQKARGVLVPNLVLSDTAATPPCNAQGRPPAVYRSVTVPAAPQTAGQPHRGPPPVSVPARHNRRTHGPL